MFGKRPSPLQLNAFLFVCLFVSFSLKGNALLGFKKRKAMKLAERNTKGAGPIRAEELGYFPVEGGETLKNLSRKTTLAVCLSYMYMIIYIYIYI